MKRLLLPLACIFLLAACETTDGGRAPPVGASVQSLEPGRYRVTFRGTSRASRGEVRDRALLRAAELVLANGYDWFEVVQRTEDIAPPTSPRFSIGLGGGSFGRRSGVGLGGSTSFGGGATAVAGLEVVAGRGAKPSNADAYDAKAVAEALGPRFGPPPGNSRRPYGAS